MTILFGSTNTLLPPNWYQDGRHVGHTTLRGKEIKLRCSVSRVQNFYAHSKGRDMSLQLWAERGYALSRADNEQVYTTISNMTST